MVTTSGTEFEKSFNFEFRNLKGNTGSAGITKIVDIVTVRDDGSGRTAAEQIKLATNHIALNPGGEAIAVVWYNINNTYAVGYFVM